MYHFFRRIHLFTGLLLLVFVLMYFLTGYVMIHGNWFGSNEPKTSVETNSFAFVANETDSALATRLQRQFSLSGQSSTPERRKDGSLRLNYVRPGTTIQTVINPVTRQIVITRKEFAFHGLANGLHRLRGYHGGWQYWIWSLLYDLASLALIVFAITGVVLWYQSTARHVAGWICLAASCGFTTAMILYLMLSK